MNKFEKNAFTLAEVLITVFIIGVIASITIPALKAKIEQKRKQTQLRKVYAEFSQAYEKLKADNGGNIIGAFPSSYIGALTTFCSNYLKCVDTADYTDPTRNFWKTVKYVLDNVNPYTPAQQSGKRIGKLASGEEFFIYVAVNNCNHDLYMLNNANGCFHVIVDLNGDQPPNIVSKDVFIFLGTNDRLFPDGTAPDSKYYGEYRGYGYTKPALFDDNYNF